MSEAGARRAHELVADGTLRVDDEGRIWRCALISHGTRREIKPRRAETISGKGYLALALQMPDTKRLAKVMAHRIVWETAHGPIPEGMQINHKDLDKSNNRLSNLEVVTPAENIRHSYANGRTIPWSVKRAGLPKWPKHGKPISPGCTKEGFWRAGKPMITDEQRLAMVAMRQRGVYLKDIAAAFGIGTSQAHRITKKGGEGGRS